MSAAGSPEVAASAPGSILLSNEAISITLQAPKGAKEANLVAEIDSLKPNEHLLLVLKDMAISGQPGVIFHIYLDLPAGSVPKTNDPHYVGALNFFAVIPSPQTRPGTARSYDITKRVKELRDAGLLTQPTTVSVIPAGTPSAGSNPSLGSLQIIRQFEH